MDPLMTFWVFLIGIIIGVIFGLTLVYKVAISPLHKKVEKFTSEKESLSTIWDKITEQYALSTEKYPYSIENFRFIGSPIDGVQFEDDQILFVEFKKDKSKQNAKQNKIKKLVGEGKVKWFEFKTK
ncbi:MAG: endonuclease [Thermoplasmatales archaeon]|nr:MAG: endonuclease [Thermoplasmatales archaeon]